MQIIYKTNTSFFELIGLAGSIRLINLCMSNIQRNEQRTVDPIGRIGSVTKNEWNSNQMQMYQAILFFALSEFPPSL